MQFSKDRRTVGRNWGKAPGRIEALNRLISIPGNGFKCYALLPNGKRGAEVKVNGKDSEWIKLDPKYKTMWYLLIRPKK